MQKINNIVNTEYKKIDKQKQNQEQIPAFTAQTEVQQIEKLPNVTPTYNVKTPIGYQKTEDINLPYGFKGHCYKLANGQRVVIVPQEGVTLVKTYVGTGAMNEPDNVRGISHYIEHNLFNGSDGLEAGEFFGTVNKMGAETNASTSFAVTDYFISSNLLKQDDLENKIRLHASMITSPKFAIEMLEKEKGIVNSEINMYQGYADMIGFNRTLKNLFNIQSTSPDLIAGTTNNINNITREDVVDYYNNNYYPANMVTVITGDVNPDETMKLISKYFNNTNKNTHPRKFEDLKPLEKTVRQDITTDKTKATQISMGFVGPQNNDTKSGVYAGALFELLTTSTTGRISQGLKQYDTRAHIFTEKIGSRPTDPTAIVFEVETNEKNCEKVLQEMFNQIHSVITNPPTDEEMQIIKKSMLNARANRFESSFGINSAIGSALLDGNIDTITDFENIVNSMTKDDLVNAAKQFLDLNKTAITVMHPDKSKADNNISFTGNMQKQAINPDNLSRYTLHNNFDVVLNNSKTDLGAFDIIFDVPNRMNNINPATPRLLQIMIEEGTKDKTDLELETELSKDGIALDITAASNGFVAVHGRFAANDMQKALQTTQEILQNPNFTPENFEYAKNKLLTKLEVQEKSAGDKLNKELFPNHPIGNTKEEIIEALKSVTLDDVKNLYNYIMTSPQGHIAVSAPFDRQPELKNVVFNEVGKFPTVQKNTPYLEDLYRPITETKVLTDTDTKNQASIVQAYTYKVNGNIKDRVAIKLMNNILGGNTSSRLFNDLREKQQLAYSVGSVSHSIGNMGMIKLNIGTTTENKDTNEISYDNVQKSIDGFNKHIQRITTEKVSEAELEEAKLYYKNVILSMNETSEDKNASISDGMQGFYGPLTDNELLKVVDEITVDDIYNAANYVFAGKPTYSILATENTLKANEEYFKTLIK
ncbi:MAG: insulinase family protein [Cyanobacteria bacterium SIG32]|nr:insulinase family protein [Cyanobacteria bacterium SIG32]